MIKITHNVLQLALVPCKNTSSFGLGLNTTKKKQNFKLITKPKALMQIAVMRWL